VGYGKVASGSQYAGGGYNIEPIAARSYARIPLPHAHLNSLFFGRLSTLGWLFHG
jgi:hypothetical protein